MTMLIGSGQVLDGVTQLTNGQTYYTEPVNIAGKIRKTVEVDTDKAVTITVQLSFKNEKGPFIDNPTIKGVAVADGASTILSFEESANYARLKVVVGGANAKPSAFIRSQDRPA